MARFKIGHFSELFSQDFSGPKNDETLSSFLGFCGLLGELVYRGFCSVRGAAVSETAVLPELIVQDFPETIIEEGRLTRASMVSPRNYFLGENHLGFDGPDYFWPCGRMVIRPYDHTAM